MLSTVGGLVPTLPADPRPATTRLTAEFYSEQNQARFGIEIGLRDKDDAISPETLEYELRLAEERHVPRLSITPTSLMDQKAWDIVWRVWGSPESSDNKN